MEQQVYNKPEKSRLNDTVFFKCVLLINQYNYVEAIL